MLMKKLIIYSAITISPYLLTGQEMLGISNSNYSGIYGISLNPSSMVGSRLYMDFNLLSSSTSFVNNYAYIERKDYNSLLFQGILPTYNTYENEERNYAVSRDISDKYGYMGMRFIGPSAMLVDGEHAYGITTAYRTLVAFHNLPLDVSNFLYEAIDYDVQHGIQYTHDQKIQFGALSWFEIGLSYAYNFHRYRWDSWTAGITLKPLLGCLGTYTNLVYVDYFVRNDTMASINRATFDYAYALPTDPADNSFPDKPFIKGYGLGADLGITYAWMKKGHGNHFYSRLCEQKYEKYNYKIGLSLLDLGFIRFSKKAMQASYTETSTEWYKRLDTLPNSTPEEIDEKLTAYFRENAEEYKSDDAFTMNPPPAVCIQFDYCIEDYLFFNTTVILGFNPGKIYLKRPSILSLSPRFETARFEATLPVSFYEWNFSLPQIGLALRYGNFFVGTDKLSTIIGFRSFSGFDVYLGLRLNISNTFRMNYIKEHCGTKKLRNIETFDYRNF